MVANYAASGLTRRHVPGAGVDETLATLDGAGLTHILADVRGTPMALVLPNGAVDVERYGVFGEEDPANLGRFGFTGQMRIPELGLFYYKNRFYDPKTGRFLTPDPLGYVDGPNLYAYVLNDPVNNVDPLGLEVDSPEITMSEEIVVIGVRGGGGGGGFGFGGFGGFPRRGSPSRPALPDGLCIGNLSLCDVAEQTEPNDSEGMGPRPPCSVVSIGVQAGFAQGVGGNVGASAFFDFASGRIGIALTSGPTAGEGAFAEIQLGLFDNTSSFEGLSVSSNIAALGSLSAGAAINPRNGRLTGVNFGVGVGLTVVPLVNAEITRIVASVPAAPRNERCVVE